MNKIIAAGEHFQYATAVADSFDLAVNEAVGLLAGQIMTDVRSESTSTMSEQNINGHLNGSSYFSNVTKTFSNVRLSDYHILMTDKPSKKSNTYTAFVYISSEKVSDIITEIKQNEKEAALERERQIKNDIKFYYDEGIRAIQDIRIGDALKYLYWGYQLSSEAKIEIERNGASQPSEVLFSSLIDQTLNNIKIVCEGGHEEIVNEFQSVFIKQLGFYYKTDDSIYKRITCLDFKYNNGNTYIDGPRVRDGVSVAELSYDMDHINIHCIYNYDANETPPQIQEIIKTKKQKNYASADKIIQLRFSSQAPLTTTNEVSPEKGRETLIETPKALTDTCRFQQLNLIMAQIETAIAIKSYESVKQFFTEEGYESFDKLIRYGKASMIGEPQYEFIPFGHLVICRYITMQFRFRNNKQFIEKVVFRFNDDNVIESLAFALSDIAQHNIMDNEDWKRDSRLTLLSFMEDYQTAYALGRIEYLERIFSENALIISGYKVLKKTTSDGIKLNGYTHYDTLSKSQYMARLRRHFKTKEYINLNFTETDFSKAWNTDDFFGIRVRQEYFSNTYGDVGYLFLLVDLRNEDPVIHVRAWQDDKLPIEQLFSLKDVY